jgi:diamine N-acetyltransferase
MDTQPRTTSYLASSSRIGIRHWHRRHDRQQINRWPPYAPALPLHWIAAPPAEDGVCVSYAVDLLAPSPADRLIGRISARPVADAARIGIVMHPHHLGQGLGTEALGLFVSIGRQLGAVELLILDVAAENTRAVRCYERSGFEVMGSTTRGGYRYLDMGRYLCIPSNS